MTSTGSTSNSKRARAGACATCRVCSLSRGPTRRQLANNVARDGRETQENGIGAFGSQELFLEMVPLYFYHIHNIAHTIFHEPSFMRRLQDGSASMIHVYAMCALAARYSNHRIFRNIAPCARGKLYATEAIRRCHAHMVSPSLETVQGFLLIGYYFSGEGSIQGKHIYVGLAHLHADLLTPEDTPTLVLQEERRRTWLSIHVASHWSASDMATEPTYSSPTSISLPQIDDADFHTLSPELLPLEARPSTGSRCDMWAQMARTLNIFTKINVLLRRLSQSGISFDEYCKEAATLEHALDQWERALPPNLAYTYENFTRLVEKQIGQTFLSMHVGYYHFRQMLFFPFLDSRLAQWAVRDRAAKCKESATIVSDILQYSETTPNCKMDYFIYGHIAVVSSSVHLHSLLFSEDQPDLSLARQRLVFNFQYLMGLKPFWSVVDHHVTHLRTFQNSCRQSMSSSFVLDNWMARFLTEHSSALFERQLYGPHIPSLDGGIVSTEETNSTASSGFQFAYAPDPAVVGTTDLVGEIPGYDDLSQLLEDEGMSGEAIVDSALSWLLHDDLRVD
ncbi:hypothetical protein FE257_009099 [Aspergillus nanangensis]|uniref:Xylanolytic transcriptional activator regulatory domain-containing protein n=1 Tax=Aspergillus nanangensis TaxID=2582783 RepID=A0AAD4CX85_ASPNN|nr:hypothetical protein FE257_009099 [Aspergillus nanangensis]